MKASSLILALSAITLVTVTTGATGCGGTEQSLGKSHSPIENEDSGEPCSLDSCEHVMGCLEGQTGFNFRCELRDGTCQPRNDCAVLEDGCTMSDCASSAYACADGGYVEKLTCKRGPSGGSGGDLGVCGYTFDCVYP